MPTRSPIGRLIDAVRRAFGYRVAGPIDHLAYYRARVVAQAADGSTVDLQPDDRRVPGVPGAKLKHGLPGATVLVQAGAHMLLGWEGGDPEKPFAEPSWESGATVTKLVLKATNVYLGDEAGADALVKKTEFEGHTHAAGMLVIGMTPVTGATAVASSITGTTLVKAV